MNQADTRFVGILNRNIRICHFLDPNTLIAKTKSLKKQRALYRKKQAESFEISFYIGGFEPGLEYQRVLVLDVDSRATHLLQEEAFFKSWEKPKTRKAGAVQNFLQNNPATANFLLINTKTPKFSLIRTETVCGQKSDWKIGAGCRRDCWLVGGLVGWWQYRSSTSPFYKLSNIHHSTASFKGALYTSEQNT